MTIFQTQLTHEMNRKLTLFLVCAFEIGLILFLAAWTATANPAKITTKNILTLFPACELPSSLGQRCKYEFKNYTPRDFLEGCCPDGHKMSATASSLEIISANNWLWYFPIISPTSLRIFMHVKQRCYVADGVKFVINRSHYLTH